MCVSSLHILHPFSYKKEDQIITIPTSQKVASIFTSIGTFSAASGGLLLFIFLSPGTLAGLCSFSTALIATFGASSSIGTFVFFIVSYVVKRHDSIRKKEIQNLDSTKPEQTNRKNDTSQSANGSQPSEDEFVSIKPVKILKEAGELNDGSEISQLLLDLEDEIKFQKVETEYVLKKHLLKEVKYKIIQLNPSQILVPLKKAYFEIGGGVKEVRKGVLLTLEKNNTIIKTDAIYAKTKPGVYSNPTKREEIIKEIGFTQKYNDEPGFMKLHSFFTYQSSIKDELGNSVGKEEKMVFVLDLCKEGDLFELMKDNRDLLKKNYQIRRDIQRQLLEIISNCHGNEDVHCDIKPENILLNKNAKGDYEVVLGDYGSMCSPSTLPNCVGTAEYIPPEAWNSFLEEGEIKISYKFDIWSLGMVFLEIEGMAPKLGPNETEEEQKAIGRKIQKWVSTGYQMSQQPKENTFEHFVLNSMLTSEDKRPNALEVLERFNEFCQSEKISKNKKIF